MFPMNNLLLYLYLSGFYKITQIVSTDHNCADTTFKRVEIKNPFEFYIQVPLLPIAKMVLMMFLLLREWESVKPII